MKPAVKYPLITLGILVLLAPALYYLAVTVALQSHAKEDRIVYGSMRIEEAINAFIEKYGNPPGKLAELIPEFMESTPDFPEISRIDYQLSANGQEWTLDLHWTSRRVPLIYRRTNGALSPEDHRQRVKTAYGCHVLTAGQQ